MVQYLLWEILTAVDQAEAGILKEEALMTEVRGDLFKCTRLFVTVAEKVAKYPSGQPVASLYFAMIASKAIEVLIPKGLTAGILKDPPVLKTGRCLKLFVMSAETAVKFPLGQVAKSRFTAVIALGEKKAAETERVNLFSLNIQSSLRF